MPIAKKPATTAPKRGRDETRTKRATARLEAAQGKRLVVDLDAPARQALEELVGTPYGKTQAEVVRKALTQAAKRSRKAH